MSARLSLAAGARTWRLVRQHLSRCKSLQDEASFFFVSYLCVRKELKLAVPCRRFVRDGGDMDEEDAAPLASFCVKQEDDDGFENPWEGATATWSRGAATKRARDLQGDQEEVRTACGILCLSTGVS